MVVNPRTVIYKLFKVLEEKTEQPSTHVRVNLIFYYIIIFFLKDHLVVVNNNKKGSINIQTQRPNVYFQTMIDSKLWSIRSRKQNVKENINFLSMLTKIQSQSICNLLYFFSPI